MAKTVRVVLLKDVDGLGREGEARNASFGYVKNYLLPRGLVALATPEALKRAEQRGVVRKQEEVTKAMEVQTLAERLRSTHLVINAKANEHGALYGSIGAEECAHALAQQGITSVQPSMIRIEKRLTEVGSATMQIRLTQGLTVDVPVEIKNNSPS